MDQNLLLSFEKLEREHWWFAVRRRIVLDTIAVAIPAAEARVVEVGCGTGGLLRDLAELYPSAQLGGVEPSADAAAVARGRECEVVEALFEDLPLPSASVDLLVALDVLEHCADDHTAAAEAYRVLRPGGTLIATVPALPILWGPHDDLNAHHRRYVRPTLKEPLRDAGFEIDRISYFNMVLLPLGALGRFVSRVTNSGAGSGVEIPPSPVNATMRGLFGLEVPLLRRVDLPVGMSLMVVARKPAD